MATISKALARTAAATSSATLYTVPANTTTVITNIAVANTAESAGTITILLDDVDLHTTTAIAANSTVYIDCKQVLAAAKTIKGFASATTIDFHISGVEIA